MRRWSPRVSRSTPRARCGWSRERRSGGSRAPRAPTVATSPPASRSRCRPVPTRAQAIDKGPVYMRSGGPAWHLLSSADAIYAYDYLGGMFRIDRGKSEPTCTEVFGYDSAVAIGGKLLVARQGIERLAPGKPCKASSAKIDDKAQGSLHVRRRQAPRRHARQPAHCATTARRSRRRRSRARSRRSPRAATARASSTVTAASCCSSAPMAPSRARSMTTSSSIRVPWSIPDAITRADGTVVLLARNRDGHGPGRDVRGRALRAAARAVRAH